MSYSGDAAEQVVRMSLEGAEVAAKITGAGAKQVAVLYPADLPSCLQLALQQGCAGYWLYSQL